MLKEKSPFEFAKSQFEKYISYREEDDLFDTSKNPKQLIKKYQKILADKFIEEYGNPRKVAEKFVISSRTLYNWLNKKAD
jgi:transcriptional regulator with PAS, ATPase and Fis domain